MQFLLDMSPDGLYYIGLTRIAKNYIDISNYEV